MTAIDDTMALPERPKLYHITHVENLKVIARDGQLVSDREMIQRGGPSQMIGMSSIKRRRLEEIEVSCHQGTNAGDYVPFYFCPRSVMLYVIHRANHPELTYRGGQDPIVHLQADLMQVIAWANEAQRRWAFSLSNAGAFYTEFRAHRSELNQLNWSAIASTDFRDRQVQEFKQAEFLLHRQFPFALVERIGIRSSTTWKQAIRALTGAEHKPAVEKRPEWYF